MSAAWVAVSVRGLQLLRRTTSTAPASALVGATTWEEALDTLLRSGYGDRLPADAGPAAAHRAAVETLAWRLRVLGGWMPPAASSLARAAVAPIEIGNVERHLAEITGAGPASEPIGLGALSVVSHRLHLARTPAELRRLLARSAWGDPGADDAPTVAFGLRVALARRALAGPDLVGSWARSAAVVLLARERFGFGRPITTNASRDLDRLLGTRWRRADTSDRLRATLPTAIGDVLADVGGPDELWRAELAVVRRIENDAAATIARHRFGPELVAAIFASMLVDLWRVLAGIEGAATGRPGAEVLDAMAS